MKRRGLALLVLLLAFSVRMLHLQTRALWYDEAFAVLYASLSPARMVYGTVTPVQGAGAADVHPLLYYFLLHSWMGLVGRSPLAVRFLSVGLGLVTVAMLWRLAAWCFDRWTGLAVGLLAAVNPLHVAYSQEARMYALLGLAAVTAAWGLLRALQGPGNREQEAGSREQGAGNREQAGVWARLLFIVHCSIVHCRWWTLYAVAAALALYAHNLGVFVLLALHLLVVARRQWRPCLPPLALADLVALFLFGPWLVGVLPGQLGFVGRGYWLASPGLEEVARAVMLPVFTFYEPAPFWLLSWEFCTSVLLLALVSLRTWRTHSRAGWFLLLCWVPVLALFLISQWRPVYLERALLPSALFYLVALGWLLARGMLPRFLYLGVVVLLIVAIGGSLVSHYTYASFPRPPFQESATYLQAHVEPADVVVHTNKLTYFPMHYYAPDLPAVFLADPPGSDQDTLAHPTQEALGIFATPTLTEAVGLADTVWLVVFDREIAEAGGMHPYLEWLVDRYREISRCSFNDLSVVRFERRP
jgi:4-amino-4-deoxy-L-arabinose transferase-like glycosyltransferase